MADNYLEKRYRELFGSATRVNPETGFEEKNPAGNTVAKIAAKIKKTTKTTDPAK